MNTPSSQPRRPRLLALLAILGAPLLLLAPAMFGDRTFVPFDLAQFSPVKTALTAEELAAVTAAQNTDPTEVPLTFLPELRFAREELAEGRLPEWNPYARGGIPLLATAVVGLLYPPNWITLLPDDPADGLVYGAYLSLAIAGLLMFGFLRALGLGHLAALFGGLAFMFSGTLYSNLHFYQRIAALIWLPGMLWAVHSATACRGPGRALPLIGLALCMAMTWLAGFPPYAAPVVMVTALYALTRLAGIARASGAAPALQSGGLLMLAAAAGFGLAAVQLLPMFAFFPESNRTVMPTPDQLAAQGFDPAGLLGLILPDAFGHPHLTAQLDYGNSPLALWLFTRAGWESGQLAYPSGFNFVEYTLFPGTLVLLLAIAALWHRGPKFTVFAGVSLLSLFLLSFASSSLAWLHELPGMRNVPASRFVGPTGALLAALAAFGFERARRGLDRTPWILLLVTSAAMAAALFTGYLAISAMDPAATLETMRSGIHEKFSAALPDLPRAEVDRYVTASRVSHGLDLLRANLWYGGVALALASAWVAIVGAARRRPAWLSGALLVAMIATVAQLVTVASPVASGRELEHRIDSDVHEFLRARRDAAMETGGFTVARGHKQSHLPFLLPPCTLVPERIRDLNIYTFVDQHSHKVFPPLHADILFKDRWVKCLPDHILGHPLLDLLGVRYILSERPLENVGAPVGPQLRGPHGEFLVYERPGALPRAFVVPTVTQLTDEDAVIDALTREDLDPRAAALVIAAEVSGDSLPAGAPEAATREVRFLVDVPNELQLQVEPGPAGYLVLSDSYMSGWTATVNGAPARILRANVSMRAVAVPEGEAEVRFSYRTPGLDTGMMCTSISAAVLLLLLLWWRRNPNRGRDRTPATD